MTSEPHLSAARAPAMIGHDAIVPDVLPVPGGWFLMGSDRGRPDERPVHRVRVRAVAMGRLPVTNREFGCYIAAGGQAPRFWSDPRFSDPLQPVVGVPWAAAVAYCDWLAKQTGRRFRLPTEAEWEHAAIGGEDGRLYPWGEAIPESRPGVPIDGGPMDRPARAGSGPLNEYGIRDMGWNVHEWCSDWYSAVYYSVSPAEDPRGPHDGSRRASRGGAWRHQVKISRCAARSSIPPGLEYSDYGFRVVVEDA